jgi:hypothetical protein
MSFNPHSQLNSTPEARKAQVDQVRQEFADAQHDGSIIGELYHIAWRTATLPWRVLTWPLHRLRSGSGFRR